MSNSEVDSVLIARRFFLGLELDVPYVVAKFMNDMDVVSHSVTEHFGSEFPQGPLSSYIEVYRSQLIAHLHSLGTIIAGIFCNCKSRLCMPVQHAWCSFSIDSTVL